MPAPDPITRLLAKYPNALHFLLDSPEPLGDRVLMHLEDHDELLEFLATEANAEHAGVPAVHRRAVVAEIAKPRRDDELLLFVVVGDELAVTRIDRARIERDVGPPVVLDARNHFPVPWPKGWRGPYALDNPDTYRIDTSDCQLIARILDAWDYQDIDDEGNPRHSWRLELGVTRALDPALASDDQVAAIAAHFRHCGPWVDQTHLYERRHPSRRIFSAEVGAHPKGTPWPEVQPPEVMLGPPPGWEPVGKFREGPIVFRIEGTELRVEWTPPPGANWYEAATGRVSEPSRFTISTTARRKPTDEEVGTVFAMLGGAAFVEKKGSRSMAKGKARARVFLATAGWLRAASGRA